MNLFYLIAAATVSAKCVTDPKNPLYAATCKMYADNKAVCERFVMYGQCIWEDKPSPSLRTTIEPSPIKPTHGIRTTTTSTEEPVPPTRRVRTTTTTTEPTEEPTEPTEKPTEGPTSDPAVVVELTGNYDLEPCSYSAKPRQGVDISSNFKKYPNPFVWPDGRDATHNPANAGVTLISQGRQAKCNWDISNPTPEGKVPFLWTAENEQCILNGNFGPMNSTHTTCTNGDSYPEYFTPEMIEKWANATNYADNSVWPPTGRMVKVKGIPGEGDKEVEVAIGAGHGVLASPCGGVALVKNIQNDSTNYAFIMRTGTIAWSYEISSPARYHLATDNSGGTCYIPDVAIMDEADVLKIMDQL